jgi:TetR/AcrR family fatty acid metabolism transcriptional regulator
LSSDTLRDLRRSQIITAARAIVATEGVEALTISALESRLEFSRGVISYHFDGKVDLVRAVLESAVAEIDAAVRANVEAATTPEERVCAILRGNVHGFIERVEAGRVLLSFWGRIGSDRHIRTQNARLYAHYRRGAARVITDGRKSGAFAEVDVDAMATLLVGTVIGIATQAHFEPGAIDVARALEEAERTVLARLVPAARRAKPASKNGR